MDNTPAWKVPAKTFLVGEYAALMGAPAIVLTTAPCFEMILLDQGISGIHPASPAGQFWQQNVRESWGCRWHDPYGGIGGLGASSAQFIAVYLAWALLKKQTPSRDELLSFYQHYARQPGAVPPSGYDICAQTMAGCVYLNRQQDMVKSYHWPFTSLDFILIHMGQKLATHDHLKTVNLPSKYAISELTALVEAAHSAFQVGSSEDLITAVNAYHQVLSRLSLVAGHTREWIDCLSSITEIKAMKGCGALGADILLVLVDSHHSAEVQCKIQNLSQNKLRCIATMANLYQQLALITK